MKNWTLTWDKTDLSAGKHVTPNEDLRVHELSQFCWCGPVADDCGVFIIWAHHALDGREYREPDHDPAFSPKEQ